MIAQTNAVISAKSTYAAGARIQKSRATKVRTTRSIDARARDTRGQDTHARVMDDCVGFEDALGVLTVVCDAFAFDVGC